MTQHLGGQKKYTDAAKKQQMKKVRYSLSTSTLGLHSLANTLRQMRC